MKLPDVLLLLSLQCAASSLAAEPPAREGLVFWLNASAQPEARQAAALPPIGNRRPIDILLDSSPAGRHATQPLARNRPTYVTDGRIAYADFDGKEDFLALSGARRLAAEFTVFVLAAPRSNPGKFTGLFAAAEAGKNDYTTGLNLDFGPNATADLSVVNVESAGASGFRTLLTPGIANASARPFGDFHVFTVRSRIGKKGDELYLDGFKGGERDRLESHIGLDQLVLGARFYSNDPAQPPFAQGFFDGAVAEALAYDRALTDDERSAVEQALLSRAAGLNALLRGGAGHALETVSDAPLVQMLAPGFTVQELPLQTGNLNNVRYRYDGKVVAVGYDGRIHLLSDTDGDGLEDKDELFWEQKTMRGPIGVALTAEGDPRGDGVFVGSKGKVSLFLDRDRDGRAEEEIIVATGWKESFHGVDTVGLAIDPKDGSLYFGLGCANFADPYLIDKSTGRSAYDLGSTHGTIQRLSADFSRRETICTGVRFTCALAFNREGDLFATEQEGATWLPNGNPFDELLHIERGRHYGFPPRHPKHLPDVVDQPAVFEYGPQHQSTVGMVFNEGVNGGPHFGPEHWRGDAIVCGESRGKLYRTKLVKTAAGYVAQNQLIACFGLLLVDACVTPQGDLLVACHSGPPDWGTGPAGQGRLFKIRYTGRTLPQPTLAWAAAPEEFRVAFNRPLSAEDWANAKEKIRIEAGRYVSAGDRFETVRPGYQAVRDQMATPRRWVEVRGAALSDDRRTLILRVPAQTEAVNYAITLPLPDSWKQSGGLTQHPQMDIQTTLNGVEAEASASGATLRCVLPYPSLAAAAAFSAGSAEHQRFLEFARQPGAKVVLHGGAVVSNPFVPSVQPGAKLDWDRNADAFASALFAVQFDGPEPREVPCASSASGAIRSLTPTTVDLRSIRGVRLIRGDLQQALNPQRLFVPWANSSADVENAASRGIRRTDVKGRWSEGKRLFFGTAGCSGCHAIRGDGAAFGPDLTNLVHRDRGSVLRDILDPSATINPDQAGSLVKLKDGVTMAGIVRRATADAISLALPGATETKVERARIVAVEPLKTSLMPEGYRNLLSPEEQEDLLTFLLMESEPGDR